MRKKYILVTCVAAIILVLLIFTSNAAFDEDNAVHIQPREIENATLAIGTHLIHLGSMSEELYEIASVSAQESGQNGKYYKSELAEGAWYEISAASSLEDIMEVGRQVDDSTIQALFFTHHTKADGITYDLRTGETVNIYDINNPYNMHELSELSQLKNQMQLIQESGVDVSILEEFFESKLQNDATEEYDRQLEALNVRYLQMLNEGASDADLDIIKKLMGKVDAARRYEVTQIAVQQLNVLIEQIAANSELAGNSDLMGTLGDAQAQMESSGNTYAAERMEEGETTMSRIQYELMQELIDAVQNGDTEAANAALEELDTLFCIMDGRSVSPEKEIALMESRLIPAAQQVYDETGSETAQNELDFYNRWKEKLEGAGSESESELSRLYDEREKLQEERLAALDMENLVEARRLETLIEEKTNQIRNLEDENPEETMDGSVSASIQEMKGESLEILEEESPDLEQLSADVEGIGALCQTNPDLAGSALKELYEKMASADYLNENDQYANLMNTIEEYLAENISLLDGTFSVEEVLEEIERIDGASFGDEGTAGKPAENAAALIGLAMFQEQTEGRIGDLAELLTGKAQSLASKEHTFVYPKLAQETSGDYAPADRIAEYIGYRYVWNDNKKRATLTLGKQFYEFQAFQAEVRQEKDQTSELSKAAKFQSTVYLPGEYVTQEFGCQIYEVFGTGYCVLADTSIMETASEVCDALIGKGGG